MVVDILDIERELIGLRQQAKYWTAQHARACQRERTWKELAQTLEATVQLQAAQLKEKCEENEALKARVLWLELQVCRRKISEGQTEARSGGAFSCGGGLRSGLRYHQLPRRHQPSSQSSEGKTQAR